MATRIAVDYENNASTWWDEARRMGPPALLAPLFGTEDEIVVADEVAEDLLTWASSVPGWADGPKHARYPLLYSSDKD